MGHLTCQIPTIAPYKPGWGVVGLYIDRCIIDCVILIDAVNWESATSTGLTIPRPSRRQGEKKTFLLQGRRSTMNSEGRDQLETDSILQWLKEESCIGDSSYDIHPLAYHSMSKCTKRWFVVTSAKASTSLDQTVTFSDTNSSVKPRQPNATPIWRWPWDR